MLLVAPLLLLASVHSPTSTSADSLAGEAGGPVPEIVVEGERIPAKGVPFARTELDPARLGPNASRDLGDLLAGAPGVQVRRCGGFGAPALLSLRGSSPDAVLVLRDGERVNGAAGGGVDLSSISLAGVERVDVLRGGASLLFGAGAIGGAVDVVSLPNALRDESRAALEVASMGGIGATGSIARAWSAGWARIVARRFRSDGDFSYADSRRGTESVRLNAGASGEGVELDVVQRLGAGELRVAPRLALSRGGSPGTTEFPTPDARRDDERANLGLRFAGPPGELAACVSRTERLYADPSNPLGTIDERHEASAISARGDGRFGRGPACLDLGFETREETLESTTDGDRSRRTGAVYTIASVASRGRADRSWRATGGVRFDAISEFAPALTSRIGGTGRIGRTRARATIGTSFRAPGFDDLFWSPTGFAVGNPDLVPERAVDWDVGLDGAFGPGTARVSLDFFHQTIDDLIRWTPGPGGLWRPSNLSRAEISGVEAAAMFNASEAFGLPRVDVNATILSARDRSGEPNTDGRYLPGRARRLGSLRIGRSIGRSVRAESTWRAVGAVPRTAANTKEIAAYVVGGVALSVAPRGGVDVRAEVENAAGVEYEDFHDFPLPGRQFRLAVAWRKEATPTPNEKKDLR